MGATFEAAFSYAGQPGFPTVIGFFTEDRRHQALRLRESLLRLNLGHRLCLVPSVHSSITTRGDTQSWVNKPGFIGYWRGALGQAVLYVDCDMVFCDLPRLVFEIHQARYDLAVFNWLSGEDNTTYFPASPSDAAPSGQSGMVAGFSIGFRSATQLIASGAVQYWGAGNVATALLHLWLTTVLANPRCRDDHSLDFAHNNFKSSLALRRFWLPRAYCRYAWWPQVDPVINHPDIPAVNQAWAELLLPEGLSRYYEADLEA